MNEPAAAAGLLLLRVTGAVCLYTFHVRHKLENLSDAWQNFPDPIGVGHAASLVLALGAEAGCSWLVALGVFTRLACLPIVGTMLMVLLLRARGFAEADVEAAVLYALLYAYVALVGPGAWTLAEGVRRVRTLAAVRGDA